MRRIVYEIRHISTRNCTRLSALIGALLLLAGHDQARVAVFAQAPGCLFPANGVVAENCQAGDTDWDLANGNDPDIQGYATDISVNTGQTVTFKVDTAATAYRIDIYRLGYYGGAGARKVATLTHSGLQAQPACLEDEATGLIDCGNWAASASWTATGAVSGLYIAKLTRTDGVSNGGSGQSHMVFVVRDDARHANLLFQTSDTTWQAYNRYGGNSLYFGGPGGGAAGGPGRAHKVSYNRPFDTRDHDPQSWLFNAEYPMLRWLEANGYDLSYATGVDSERSGALLKNHNVFLSVGHDEYWSAGQRANVESARDAGVHLAFFSGNEVFWKTRWESSIDGAGTAFRTLVSYKETFSSTKIDPDAAWTGTWRDPRFSPPADGGKPENGLTGTIFTVNCCTYAITVPAEMGAHRFWRNTALATLAPGQTQTLAEGTLGYEWDEDLDNGFRPAGLTRLSSTTVSVPEKLVDFGTTYAPGVANHALTLYRRNTVDGLGNPHTALVFGAGTVQWSWGLDGTHDRGGSTPDLNMQQATVNLLADMTVQPGSLQSGLIPTSPSTDTDAPIASISSPASGATVGSGDRVTIIGNASDTGGSVAGVEVSVDGGATWHAAKGTSSWTYDWFPNALGPVTLTSRATDDSGNIGAPSDGVPVTVGAGRCPCTNLWNEDTTVPTVADSGDDSAVEVGVKFTSEVDGFITGLRFYKGLGNTGTHVGNLWTSSGTLLRSATFTGESAAGWQRVTFGIPVPIMANTTYVASYHTNVGHYSADRDYFATMGVDAAPLHAPAGPALGGNGVFRYGISAFPNQSFRDTNYWVDVDFSTAIIDVTLTISNITTTAIDGTQAVISWTTNDDADSRVDYSTNPSLPPAQTQSMTSSALVRQHTMHLTGLTPNATYFARLTSHAMSGDSAVALAPGFTTPGPTLHDTASVDFSAGTLGETCDVNGQNCVANTYVAETADGELMLAPTAKAEFSGTTLPPGWIGVLWQPSVGGSVDVHDGNLFVDGARVGTCDLGAVPDCESGIYGPGHSLEFVATFSGDPFQHAGFGIRFEDQSPRAVFSTDAGGQLKARTFDDSGTVQSTSLGTLLLGLPHRYRIDWNPASVDYYVDGAIVASHAATLTGPMRPVAASDYSPFGGNIVVDWMRMQPYASTGSFLSRVFDGTTTVDWKTATWTDVRPAGTSLVISMRTGDTPVPDATWSAFTPLAAPGPITAHSRYIQYRAQLTSPDPTKTPELTDIIITTSAAPVANPDHATTPLNTSFLFRATGPTSLTFNDTDADTPQTQLRVTSVSTPAHGTAALGSNRTVTYTPFTGFTGTDTFTYTVTDGLLFATGTVTVTVGNDPPVGNNGSVTTAEDTAASVGLVASDANGDPLTYTIVTPPAHGTLSGVAPSLVYTPAANYAGPDSFVFTVSDGMATSAPATVNITVTPVNDAPVATPQSATTAEDTAKAITLSGSDVDGDALTFSVATGPAHGALSGTAPNLTYTPALNYNGPDSFTFTAYDGTAYSAPATVSITVTPVNDAPVATPQSVTTAEDTAKAITLSGSDVDGNALTFSVVTGPAHGALSGTAPNLTYTPVANYFGPDSFTFKAYDGAAYSTPATVSLTVTPVIDVQPGLVLALGFDEASGNALDASGNGNVAVVSGTTRVPGIQGNALHFNGIDDIATVANAASLNLTTGMTLEAWVKPGAMEGWETVILKERGAEDFSYALYAMDGGSLPTGAPVPSGNIRRGGHRTLRGGWQLPAGAWTHLATTYDGAKQRLFIDGVEVSNRSQTGAIDTSTGVLRIGGNTSFANEFFEGAIDNVRIYNRALTAAEITADIDDAVLPVPPWPTPVLKLDFDEASGDALDSSGFGNVGTVQGAVRVPGIRGNAVQFDGVDDMVTVADAVSLDLKTGMTLEAWVKPDTLQGWEPVILKERGGDFSYALYAHDGGTLPAGAPVPSGNIRALNAERTLRGVSQLPIGAWTHVATTYDGATQRLFVNGVQVASRAQTGAIEVSDGALRIGGDLAFADEFFQGAIDEVRVYNRALSAAEITADMNPPQP